MEQQKKQVLLIVNPCAGRTSTRVSALDIVNHFPSEEYTKPVPIEEKPLPFT